jgi:hypothetical protein
MPSGLGCDSNNGFHVEKISIFNIIPYEIQSLEVFVFLDTSTTVITLSLTTGFNNEVDIFVLYMRAIQKVISGELLKNNEKKYIVAYCSRKNCETSRDSRC